MTCNPVAPLQSHTQYMAHIGGAMMDANSHPVDMDQFGMQMGGQWATQGMMGATHSGMPWNMMGSGWRHQNGSYGMVFTFGTI